MHLNGVPYLIQELWVNAKGVSARFDGIGMSDGRCFNVNIRENLLCQDIIELWKPNFRLS